MIAASRSTAPTRRRPETVARRRRTSPGRRCLTFAALLLVGACSSPDAARGTHGAPPGSSSPIPPGWPEGAPYITGIITLLKGDTLRIEERPQMKGGSPKAVLTMGPATLVRGIGGAERPRLRVGQRVSAWAGPRVLESYPIRAQALAIQLVEDSTSFATP